MMVEASATPGFVVPVFRHAQVDALAVVRKPFTEYRWVDKIVHEPQQEEHIHVVAGGVLGRPGRP